MNLVKLTWPDGSPFYVNPTRVLYVEADPDGTSRLHFEMVLDGVPLFVNAKESPAAIQGLFLEPLR